MIFSSFSRGRRSLSLKIKAADVVEATPMRLRLTNPDFSKFLDDTFGDTDPLDLSLPDERTAIIGKKHLEIPFEGYERIIPPLCHKILNTESDDKGIPIFAVVRGAGCGKSRLLEELRIAMNRDHQSALCLAVSFNYKSPEIQVGELWQKKTVSLTYLVITKMLHAFYGITDEEVDERLRSFDHLDSLLSSRRAPAEAKKLFRATVLHMVKKREQRLGGLTSHFCLAIDESLRPLSSLRPEKEEEDIYSTLRNALLDPLSLGVQPRLIMSSLDYAFFLRTFSGRTILPVVCGVLSEDHVVGTIWAKTWEKYASEAAKPLYPFIAPRLRVFAASIIQIARLVQFANDEIQLFLVQHSNFTMHQYHLLMRQLISKVSAQITDKYTSEALPLQLYPLFFLDSIRMDDQELHPNDLIMSSIYTNVIDRLDAEGKGNAVTFTPEASLFRIVRPSRTGLFKGIISDLEELILDDVRKSGQLLESLAFRWLRARFQVMISGVPKFAVDRTIGGLLGMKPDEIVNVKLKRTLREQFILPESADQIWFDTIAFKERLNDESGPSAFFSELQLPSSDPIYMKKAKKRDCFDFMVVVTLRSTNRPLPIFFELKSAGFQKSPSPIVPRQGAQYQSFKALIEKIPPNATLPLLREIQDRRYLYVYLTDWDFVEGVRREIDENCYVLNQQETKSLLTMLFPVYRAAIAAMPDK